MDDLNNVSTKVGIAGKTGKGEYIMEIPLQRANNILGEKFEKNIRIFTNVSLVVMLLFFSLTIPLLLPLSPSFPKSLDFEKLATVGQ